MTDYDPELVKQALAEKDKEIERLTFERNQYRNWWNENILSTNERIAALEAENAKLKTRLNTAFPSEAGDP